MAGDWIKLRANLESTVEVIRLSGKFNLDTGAVVFRLYQLASWFEKHGDYGKMETTFDVINAVVQTPGMAESLSSIGWLTNHDGVLMLRRFCTVSATRKSLGKALRNKILHGASCAACNSTDDLVIDHKVPVVHGGSCDETNLQPLCAPCNRAKGRRTMSEFMAGRCAA